MVVAMVQVFAEVLKVPLGEYEVAHLAFQIERQDLGLAGGRQDHYAAAFGGCNYLEFGANDRVVVNPLRIKPEILCELEESLVVVFTGASRQSDVIISKQAHAVADGGKSLEAMHNLKKEGEYSSFINLSFFFHTPPAVAMKEALLFGKIDGMAQILQRGWEAKKATSDSVSTPLIESLFQAALGAGALAGKVSGAGGGGFIMFLVEPRRKAEVMRAMQSNGFAAQCPRFTAIGSISWCPKRVE